MRKFMYEGFMGSQKWLFYFSSRDNYGRLCKPFMMELLFSYVTVHDMNPATDPSAKIAAKADCVDEIC